MTNTFTVVLTDTVTGNTTTGSADFTVGTITVTNPGDQTNTVGNQI